MKNSKPGDAIETIERSNGNTVMKCFQTQASLISQHYIIRNTFRDDRLMVYSSLTRLSTSVRSQFASEYENIYNFSIMYQHFFTTFTYA